MKHCGGNHFVKSHNADLAADHTDYSSQFQAVSHRDARHFINTVINIVGLIIAAAVVNNYG